MMHFVHIEGRWINPQHVTHVADIEIAPPGTIQPVPGAKSCIALTSKVYIYTTLLPIEVLSLLNAPVGG
jgi:hypothetical protein